MEQNKYYIFTKTVNDKSTNFEAKFVEIINQTLIVTDYCEESQICDKSHRSIPLEWIKKTQPKRLINNFMENP
jgi:hypothetical protein